MLRFLKRVYCSRPTLFALFVVSPCIAFFYYFEILKFENKTGLAAVGGIALAILALIQLHSNRILQRANVVKDLASNLYIDTELSETFHYLVYSYDNKTYNKYKDAKEKTRVKMNRDRREGLRFFDPNDEAKFEGSEEERRIDSLLGYIDIIAYHYHCGLINIVDIAGVLGYHLATIRKRDAITEYRESIPGFWYSSYREYGYESDPLRYLDHLLKEYARYCKRRKRRQSSF